MKGVVAFAITLIILVGGGTMLDAVLTTRAEEGAASAISARLGGDATVRLSGWPVTVRLLVGGVPRADVRAQDVPLEGSTVRLTRLDLVLRDIEVDLSDVLDGDPATGVRTGPGTFEALLAPPALAELLGVRDVRVRDGVIEVDVAGTPVQAAAAVEGDQVVLRPVGAVPPGAEAQQLTLPPLPAEARVEGVSVTADGVVLRGRVLGLDSETAAP